LGVGERDGGKERECLTERPKYLKGAGFEKFKYNHRR